jgi:hypothetical protein
MFVAVPSAVSAFIARTPIRVFHAIAYSCHRCPTQELGHFVRREFKANQACRETFARLTRKSALELEKKTLTARDLLPKLEQKLLALVLEFKERNG